VGSLKGAVSNLKFLICFRFRYSVFEFNPMEVILLKDVSGFGRRGEIKSASDGYARNLLFPRGLAKPATATAIADLKLREKQKQERRELKLEEIKALAHQLTGQEIVVRAKPNKTGGLFAAVNERAIAHAMSELLGRDIEERTLVLTNPIKELGQFTALWIPSEEVKQEINISVEAES
jgi:large subunit ribosomal protein L9